MGEIVAQMLSLEQAHDYLATAHNYLEPTTTNADRFAFSIKEAEDGPGSTGADYGEVD